MAAGDGSERGLEVGEGLAAVDLAGFDQRGDAAPGDAALIMASEERIFAIERDGAHEVFHAVAVDLDAAVGEERLQSVPMIMDIGQLLAVSQLPPTG